MDYFVRMTLNEKFVVNQEVLSRVLAGRYGDNTGSTVDASILEFKDRVLSIRTKLQFIAESETNRMDITARCNYFSQFYFNSPGVLTKGNTPSATAILKECIDLAQSHAYGMFCHEARRHRVPIEAIQVYPMEHLELVILRFLNSIKR